MIDNESVKFHSQRGDFQNWIKDTLGDIELADKIEKINPQQPVEALKKELVAVVEARLTELSTTAEAP